MTQDDDLNAMRALMIKARGVRPGSTGLVMQRLADAARRGGSVRPAADQPKLRRA